MFFSSNQFVRLFSPASLSVKNVSTYRNEEFLLLLLLLLGLLTHGLVFLLHLLQRSDLRLLEAKHLLLIVCSQPAELLLITLVLLAQRLRRRKAGETI